MSATNVVAVLALVDRVLRAPSNEEAEAARTCIAVKVATLAGEDLQEAFRAVRPPPPTPLKTPAPHRSVKLVKDDISLDQAVKRVADAAADVPWIDGDIP